MYLIIGDSSHLTTCNCFDITYFESICSLKYLEGDYDLILVDVQINDEGIIVDNGVYFEEIIITLNPKRIISNVVTPKLLEIAYFYKIELIGMTS